MKIIQVSSYYPPHLGGQEYAVQDLSRHLAAAGHEVHVITAAIGAPAGTTTEDGVTVWRLPAVEFGHAPIMPGFFKTLRRLADRNTVVHLHVGQAFTPELVAIASKVHHFPFIAELHIDFEPSGPAGFLLPAYKRGILKPALRAAQKVVVLNAKTQKIVHQAYGIDNAAIVNNGIDEAYFDSKRPKYAKHPPKLLQLLFVGRLSKQKNLPMLIEAIALSKQAAHLDIIGIGEEQQAVEAAIAAHQLEKSVTLHGRLDRSDVLPYYATADALVMPSLYEAQPLVLLEALAARIPIIGTNVIGVAEHIQDAGIITEPTAQSLADGFARYIEDYARLPANVAAGYQRVESLRWKNLLPTYETLYRGAL